MLYAANFAALRSGGRLLHPGAEEIFRRMLERAQEDLRVGPQRPFLHVTVLPAYPLSSVWEGGSRVLRLTFLYQVTGEARYRAKAVELCALYAAREEDWNANPAEDLVFGTLALTLGLAVDWLNDGSSEYAGFRARMRGALQRMAELLDQWYDRQGWANNHSVVSLVPYAILARVFPEAPQAREWGSRAAAGVDAWVADGPNVGADGDWFEACFNYQNFLLFHLLFYWELAREEGQDYFVRPRVRKMFEVLLQALAPDGGLVNFNDNFHWDGYAQTMLTAGPVLLKGAAEYRNGTLTWAAERLRKNLDWDRFFCLMCDVVSLLLVPFERLPAPEVPRDSNPVYLRKTGYLFLRDGWDDRSTLFALATLPRTDMAFGPPLPVPPADRRTGHSHLDAGSFEYYFRGAPLTVEPGYLWANPERIAPAFHNTLSVDGRPAPLNQWNTPADVFGRLARFEGDAARFLAEVDLAPFLKIPCARRVFRGEPARGRLAWEDTLEDRTPHEYKSHFHGLGKFEPLPNGGCFRIGVVRYRVTVEADVPWTLSLGARPTTWNYRGLFSRLAPEGVVTQEATTLVVSALAQRAAIRWRIEAEEVTAREF